VEAAQRAAISRWCARRRGRACSSALHGESRCAILPLPVCDASEGLRRLRSSCLPSMSFIVVASSTWEGIACGKDISHFNGTITSPKGLTGPGNGCALPSRLPPRHSLALRTPTSAESGRGRTSAEYGAD